jgi:hypothetical protein
MGEWKTALSIRVRQSLKDDLQKIADREYRKLGNLGELLMEWSYEQLTTAGSTEKLLKRKVRSLHKGRNNREIPETSGKAGIEKWASGRH